MIRLVIYSKVNKAKRIELESQCQHLDNSEKNECYTAMEILIDNG